jgi:uncharacterized repeat protein (TIGR02543 family)
MGKLMKTYGVILLTFVFVVVGLSIFYTQPASAASYTISKDYYVYKKSNNYLYYDGTNSTYAIINWTPQINIIKNQCDANPAGGQKDFDPANPIKYMNCTGLGIQEVRSGANNLWFENANYAYIIGDVDWSETVSVGGGVIAQHGASTNNPTNGGRDIVAKAGAARANGDCDNPNPHFTNDCSILIMFNHSHPGDFGITLNNNLHSSGHEYWYDFQVLSHYRTLTFDPNGGSVTDTSPGVALWPHKSGANALREYEMGDTANNYPTPSRTDGYTFAGWYTLCSGGNPAGSSRVMNTDESYCAHWTPPITWTVTPNISINTSTALPGQTVSWTHSVTNNGPDNTDKSVSYYWQSSGYLGTGTGGGGVIPSGFIASTTIPDPASTSSHLVTQDDVNQNLCRSTVASPRAWNDNSAISVAACAFVPYNYTLIPGVGTDADNVIESGATIQVTPTVSNQAPPSNPTRSATTPWQLTQLILQPGTSIPNQSGGFSSLGIAPCSYFVGAGVTCSPVKTGSSVFDVGGGVHNGDVISANLVTVGELATGSKICFAFSVQPRAYAMGVQDSRWAHSAPTCLVIGKKPKTQIWAGDLLVRGNVTTSTTTKNGFTFGSWAEYGIIASGGITGAASGAAYASPGLDINNTTICEAHMLSFANTQEPATSCSGATNTVGHYSSSTNMPDVGAIFPTTATTPIAPSDLNTTSGVYRAVNGNQITGGNMSKGQWVVINAPTTDITITGNITYYAGNDLKSINDVPQVVIIAKSINIAGGVDNIDAWLIAPGGSINTCSDVAFNANLWNGICHTSPLVVNGPVMTDKLYLRRTFGAETASPGVQAETFNLRADAYLWAIAHASTKSFIQTVYNTELPPRF